MNKKKIIKLAALWVGTSVLSILVYLIATIPKDSKLFNPDQTINMVREGEGYSIPVLTQNEKMEYEVVNFKVDEKIVDSLGFTQDEVRTACSAGAEEARKYFDAFILNGTPEIKPFKGKVKVSIPIIVSSSNRGEMFIIGEVTKDGKVPSIRAVIEEGEEI